MAIMSFTRHSHVGVWFNRVSSISSHSLIAMSVIALPIVAAATADDEWIEFLGAEASTADQSVYLMTFSRVLAARLAIGDLSDITTFSKQQVLDCVLDAWENPMQSAVGRPRESDVQVVKKAVVFEEFHADGSKHFHVAVLLVRRMRFALIKRTLMSRHKLASHFSATHTQWWSLIRYGFFPTLKKPKTDDDPLRWTGAGVAPINLFEDGQEPFQAKAWVKRREQKDREGDSKGANTSFTKLDFTALVLEKKLRTQASVLRYFQQKGSVAMQAFVSKHQRKLQDFLDDALEWDTASEVAAAEEQTDWALISMTADKECAHGNDCPYHLASQDFFFRNAANFSCEDLAQALRLVLVAGPSKQARVPFLVGGTNTGKTSLIAPFEQLFGANRVYHLPAVTDPKYALRNWMKNKRFVLWDEFSPVEFADHNVLPVTVFKKAFNGQWFEVQVPQSFHDGNVPFRWQRGVVFTNKLEGLWTPTRKVPQEDIRHIQSRVHLFQCGSEFVPPGEVRPEIPQCAVHLCKWIVAGAARFDAQAVLVTQPILAPMQQTSVTGLGELLAAAAIPNTASIELSTEVTALGAVDVRELRPEDWTTLRSFQMLRPLEQRRLLRSLG